MKFNYLILVTFSSLITFAQNALNFNGVNNYVQTTQAGPTSNSSRTVEAWVKITTVSSTQSVIVDWGDMAISNRFTFNIINGVPRIEVGGDGVNASAPISTGSWHHLAASYDNASELLKIYVDGILSNSDTLSVVVMTSNLNGIVIGRRIDGINYFNGTIDEVRVWNYTRSQNQIASSMNKEFCSPTLGLVTYYNFNLGVAGGINTGLTTLNDLSLNSNNGTLNGFTLSGTNSNWVAGNNLNVNSTSNINPSTCNTSYTSPSGNIYTASGIYTDTIANANGCDSVITISLIIDTLNTLVTADSVSLIASQQNANYQWVNCTTNFSFIVGETSNNFVPTSSGNYAVIITNGSCVDTSNCSVFTLSGISEFSGQKMLNVTPNPTINFSIISASQFINSTLTLFDLMGNEVLNQSFNSSETINIDHLSNGIYLLQIKDKNNRQIKGKIVKNNF